MTRDRVPLNKRYQARRCSAPDCELRFPVDEGSALGARCPRCGSQTEFTDAPYQTFPAAHGRPRPLELRVLLDNVRSLTNVGSIFRTCDGIGVRHIYLGGITATPAHPKLAKTALGAEKTVPWSHFPDACQGAAGLGTQGHRLWALEAGERSESVFASQVAAAVAEIGSAPLVLVVGHEVSGVDPRIIAQCERAIEVPMEGAKGSLNVGVAFGVAAYTLCHGHGA